MNCTTEAFVTLLSKSTIMIRSIIVSTLMVILVLGVSGQSIIKIDDFGATSDDLILLGKSEVQDDFLRLTPTLENVAGACWLKKEKIDLSRGFETEFEFRVVNPDKETGVGDGFAFVIQNDREAAIGGTGDGLGYKGLVNALVLEFDTYNNKEGSSNHIDIAYYKEGKVDFTRHATVHAIPEITDGESHFARVHYKEGELTLYMDSYIFPVLSSKIDIASIINSDDSRAWIGFTAATSKAAACHDLMKWHVNYYLPPPDIDEEKVEVSVSQEVAVKNRKVKIRVSDYNKVDGDVISLKFGDKWILTEYKLKKEPHEIEITLTGFSSNLIMFANNVGSVPPNTASIVIDDGLTERVIKLKSDLESSEAIAIQYNGEIE